MQGHQAQDRFADLTPEEFQFSLTYAGRSAGTGRWVSGQEKNLWVIRSETQFAGSLGNARRVQISKLDPRSGLPVSFSESDGQGGRHFETTFDRKTGLVTVRQHRDEASQALTQDYFDPLSLIQHLRTLPDETGNLRVPMVGGNVLVTRLPDETLDSPWGETLARVYYLRPGVGLVYIESAEPHRLLRFGQTLGNHMLESFLVRAGSPQPGALEARLQRAQPESRQRQGSENGEARGGKRRARGRRRRGASDERSTSVQREPTERRTSLEAPRNERPARLAQPKRPEPVNQTTAQVGPAQGETTDAASKRRRRRRRAKRGSNKGSGGEA